MAIILNILERKLFSVRRATNEILYLTRQSNKIESKKWLTHEITINNGKSRPIIRKRGALCSASFRSAIQKKLIAPETKNGAIDP